jgi:hypothetical protein
MDSGTTTNISSNNSMSYEYKDFLILLLIVILVLSVLGINIFLVLGVIIQYIVYFLQPLFSLFGYASGNIINTTSDLAANVSHFGIEVADGTAHDVGNLLLGAVDKQDIPKLPPAAKTYPAVVLDAIGNALSMHPTPQPKPQPTIIYVPTPAPAVVIHDKVSTPAPAPVHMPSPAPAHIVAPVPAPVRLATPSPIKPPPSPEADTAANPVQKPISSSKSQWCLAGEYEKRKGCVEVDDANKCMSGQVFPTQQMCLNPTLTTNTPPVKTGYYTQYGVLFPQILYQQ